MIKAAREVGFLKRDGGKIKPFDFLVTLVFRISHSFPAALSLIITFLDRPVSRSALQQKFTEKATLLLKKCLQLVMIKQFMQAKVVATPLLEYFKNVIVIDSSSWDISEKLKDIFPGSGGSASKANCKLQCAYDYKSGSIVLLEDRKGTEPDQKYSQNIVSLIQTGALFLFDLGYWCFNTFYEIASKGAYFVSRYNNIVNFWSSLNGEDIKLDLVNTLQNIQFNSVELEGYIKDDQKCKVDVRLICFRAPKAVADERKRKLRAQAKKKGRIPTKKSLLLCEWSLFITNASGEVIPGEMIRSIYRVRWSIELIFKSWKSILRMHQCNVRNNVNRLKCELYAKLIFAVITHIIHSKLHSYLWNKESRELSFDKLWKFMVSHSESLHKAIIKSLNSFSKQVNSLLEKIIKECEKYHQKSRKTTLQMIDQMVGDSKPVKVNLSEILKA